MDEQLQTYKLGDQVPFNKIKLHHYSSEKNLNKLLLEHIDDLMKVFDEKVIFATDKKSEIIGGTKIKKDQWIFKRGVRLDLWVQCKSGNNYIIEIKNPKNNYEMFRAIGQLLGYSLKFPNAKLVLLSTSYDDGVDILIAKYNLPITFVLMTENQFFTLQTE